MNPLSPALAAAQRLTISAGAPWSKPLRLTPVPSAALLEIDGEDVGRKLLATRP